MATHRYQERSWDEDGPTRTVCPVCRAYSESAAKVRKHYVDWHTDPTHWEYQGSRDLDEGGGVYGTAFIRGVEAVGDSTKARKKSLKKYQGAMKQRLKGAGLSRRRVAEAMADLLPHDEPDPVDTDPECERCQKEFGGYHFHDWNNCPLNPEND